MVRPLTPLQVRFAELYLSSHSGTQAVKDAGYDVHSENVAAVISSENLRNPRIREAIMQQAKTAAEQAGVDALWVLKGLKENKERAMQERPVLDRHGNPTGEYVYDGAVANRSLELVGKHLKLFGEDQVKAGDTYNQVVLQGYTLEQLQAMLQSMQHGNALPPSPPASGDDTSLHGA